MGDFWGADTEALTDLYRTFERRSDAMQDMATRLDVWVVRQAHDDWEGPDAEAFFDRWETVRHEMTIAYERIEEMGRQLREEAQEQDDASEPEDGLLETLTDIGEQLYTAVNIPKDTAKELWEGIKKGRIDWPAAERGLTRLADWWESADLGKSFRKLAGSKAFKRIGRLVPVLDIYLAYEAFKDADDPLEYAAAAAGVIGMLPFPPTVAIGLVGDAFSIVDWAGEEFFDVDISREASDWFSDVMNDGFDSKRWNPLL